MIDDEELRNLFKTASEEHLQNLESGILNLEKNPNDLAGLEELLREAHSLKGDARMLGVRDVETLTHQLEHILGSIKRGEMAIAPIICDRLGQGLDALSKLVEEAVTGKASGVNTFHVLANLMGANPNPPANQNQQPSEINQQAEQPDQLAVEPNSSFPNDLAELPFCEIAYEIPQPQEEDPFSGTGILPVPPSPSEEWAIKKAEDGKIAKLESNQPLNSSPLSGYRIETIRVETRNLDVLMTQAGELTVTKIRIAHRLAEIEELVSLWEEWSRDAFVNRFALGKVNSNVIAPGKLNNRGLGILPVMGDSLRDAYDRRSIERLDRLGNLVNRLGNSVYEDTARLDIIATDLEEGIRTLRLLPLSTIFQLFPRLVRDLSRQQAKEVELLIEGGDTKADKRILEEMKDPLMHMIRNCIDHGIEMPAEREQMGKHQTAIIRLRGYQTATNIVIEIADDGRGLDTERIKQTALKRGICREEEIATMTTTQIHALIFAPGFSTRTLITEVSGRGVGLDVVRTNVERLKGTVQVESTLGKGCIFRLQLSTTLATTHVLIVQVEGISYALPVEFVQTTQLVALDDIFAIEGRETIILNGHPVSVANLADLLELRIATIPKLPSESKHLPCIILKVGDQQLGLFVDALIDEQDVVLKPQSKLLKRVRNVTGATILGTGEVCMILNPTDLMKSVQKRTSSPTRSQPVDSVAIKKQVILLVEDSIATRTQEKRILENAGYEVVAAVDGLDGFNKLRTHTFDAVVSDVQMPNLDGLSLTVKIRQYQEYNELPIILVTSLASDEDKRRGAEVGANAYITKGAFNQEVLLETLRRLV